MDKIYTRKEYEKAGSPVDLVIPEGFTTIEGSAFYGCANLGSVTIPKGVTKIGESAFFPASR